MYAINPTEEVEKISKGHGHTHGILHHLINASKGITIIHSRKITSYARLEWNGG